MIKSKLNDEGVRFKSIAIDDETRENITIFESTSKNQYRFIMPGPSLLEKEYEAVLETIKNIKPKPDYIIASGSNPKGTPEDFYKKLSKIAKKMDSRLVVDTSGDHLKRAAKAGVFLLKPNIRELGQLAGNDIDSEIQQKEAAKSLISTGNAEIVVVSLGAGGAMLVTEDTLEHLRTPTVPIRSKLGAGDSMVAGMILKLAEGEDIQQAAMYGIAAGAATVMTDGTELCTKSDTDTLYKRLVEKGEE
jgi:6-phosphofructokinase 2